MMPLRAASSCVSGRACVMTVTLLLGEERTRQGARSGGEGREGNSRIAFPRRYYPDRVPRVCSQPAAEVHSGEHPQRCGGIVGFEASSGQRLCLAPLAPEVGERAWG